MTARKAARRRTGASFLRLEASASALAALFSALALLCVTACGDSGGRKDDPSAEICDDGLGPNGNTSQSNDPDRCGYDCKPVFVIQLQ